MSEPHDRKPDPRPTVWIVPKETRVWVVRECQIVTTS